MNSPSATSSFPADTLEAANEIIRVLREELAAVAVVVGRTKDGTGYDLDWFALHKDVQACRSETRVPDRDAIIEECAKVCDAQRNEVEAEYEKENESDLLAEAVMANYCASAIRDLKATPSATPMLDTVRLDFMERFIVEGTSLESGKIAWLADVDCLRETIDEALKVAAPQNPAAARPGADDTGGAKPSSHSSDASSAVAAPDDKNGVVSEPPMAWVIVNCRGEPVRSQLPTYTDPAIHADPSRMLCICDANHEDGFPHRWLSLYAHPPVESTASATLPIEVASLISTAAMHLRTWATSSNKEPYGNTLSVAERLEVLMRDGYVHGEVKS